MSRKLTKAMINTLTILKDEARPRSAHPGLSRVVLRALQENGYVEELPPPGTKMFSRWVITPAGRAAFSNTEQTDG